MTTRADILVTNATVLTMDPHRPMLAPGALAIQGDTIAAIDAPAAFAGWRIDRTLDAGGGIVMPGLINTHTHAAMTLLRGLADDLPLTTWLNDHIFPAEAKLDARQVHDGTLLACAEMILAGTTCFCDMYLFEDAVAEAVHESGMRAVVGEVLYDFPSPNYGPLDKGFAYTQMLIDKWSSDPLITVAVEPHSPYLCAPELLQRAARLAERHGLPLVIHLSETEDEVARIHAAYGNSPVGHLERLGLLGPHLLACHCVALSADDIERLRRADVKVSHNPESNMKLASGIAPVPALLQAGICVGLGTDGCASNNNLDLFGEMDTAAKLHKVAASDPTVLDAASVLRMATIDGARALGLDHLIGSLEAGKKADLIIVERDRPHLTPMYSAFSHLVYSARGSDVATVIINGRIVMENRRLGTIDPVRVMKRVREIAGELTG